MTFHTASRMALAMRAYTIDRGLNSKKGNGMGSDRSDRIFPVSCNSWREIDILVDILSWRFPEMVFTVVPYGTTESKEGFLLNQYITGRVKDDEESNDTIFDLQMFAQGVLWGLRNPNGIPILRPK